MPTELLLPAFALTLIANAALVAVAVRWLMRSRAERDRLDQSDRPTTGRRIAAPPAAAAEPRFSPPPAAPIVEPPAAAVPPEPQRRPTAAPATPTIDPVKVETPEPEGPKPAGPRAARRKSASTSKSGAVTPPSPQPGTASRPKRSAGDETARGETRRGGRRRFSLPPLDEDHERMTRSIETFLSGNDPVDVPGASDAVEAAPTVATTVALVAIHGLDADGSPADRSGVDDVIATVERSLRSAARSADRVSTAGRGRFRIVLPATGELAARAYLRRVRATVGPSLEAADAPLGLVTATATVLDETVQVAIAQAEGRLDAALASAARDAAADESRVASD